MNLSYVNITTAVFRHMYLENLRKMLSDIVITYENNVAISKTKLDTSISPTKK